MARMCVCVLDAISRQPSAGWSLTHSLVIAGGSRSKKLLFADGESLQPQCPLVPLAPRLLVVVLVVLVTAAGR